MYFLITAFLFFSVYFSGITSFFYCDSSSSFFCELFVSCPSSAKKFKISLFIRESESKYLFFSSMSSVIICYEDQGVIAFVTKTQIDKSCIDRTIDTGGGDIFSIDICWVQTIEPLGMRATIEKFDIFVGQYSLIKSSTRSTDSSTVFFNFFSFSHNISNLIIFLTIRFVVLCFIQKSKYFSWKQDAHMMKQVKRLCNVVAPVSLVGIFSGSMRNYLISQTF